MSTSTTPELRPPDQIVDPSPDSAEQPTYSALSRRGMVNTLFVVPKKSDVDAIVNALVS